MKPIPPGLKTAFLVHAIVALIFGLIYLLIPTQFGAAVGWTMPDPMAFRLVGAAVLAFGASSWLAYRARTWDQVLIVVVMELVWTILGTLVTVWAILAGALPAIGWLNAVILAAFAVVFGIYYSRR